jgi:Domain of unknown function (DUF4185)
VRGAIPFLRLILYCAAVAFCASAAAQPAPVLTWITNSSVKLEQIIGDIDWEANARGSNLLTASQTITRFHIMGNGLGYSFENNGKLIFLFGDTISEDPTNGPLNYHAADPLAWSTTTDGEMPLVINFFTNNPPTNVAPIFVRPAGITMAGDDVPNAGITLANGVFLVCNTGSEASNTNIAPQTNDFSVLVTFNESLAFTNTAIITNIFFTNRIISILTTNLAPTNSLQGHFINVSMREYGTNVMMFGTGEYRSGDVFLCQIPTASFVSGSGTLFFAGLTNGEPIWSGMESNCYPVVQDNPTNGLPWPNDAGTAGNVSVIYSTNLNLWLMTYDGGRSADTPKNKTTGVYFSYAQQPWGPWATPQLIFNKSRDNGVGVFIYDPSTTNDLALAGPVIGSNDPLTTPGGDFAPIMIERFTRVTNSTLLIYYTLSTWNPYTVIKMRSSFSIVPVIDPGSLVKLKKKFSFAWSAPTNITYQVDYSSNLLSGWTTFTNLITSTNGTFNFTDNGTNSGGFGSTKFYRLQSLP